MGLLKTLIATVLVLCAGSLWAGELRPLGEGLPLPWPFPWAEDCPVDWNAMNGRYALADSSQQKYLDLKISVITSEGFKLVRAASFDQNGVLQSQGFTYVADAQHVLSLYLMPSDSSQQAELAVIKLYYESPQRICSANYLVPILTLTGSNDHASMSYKMVRVSDDSSDSSHQLP